MSGTYTRMKKVAINGLDLWQFDLLARASGINHFVTDRNSARAEKEFTLSFSSSPDRAEILANRSLVATAMGVADVNLFMPSQVHKTNIVCVTKDTAREALFDTDALITSQPGVCIAVMSADCVPIILYDRTNRVVAAVHSGWRGTVAKILEKTLNEMHLRFGTKGHDLVAGIGPSVSQDSYEVGEEVVREVTDAFGVHAMLMIPQQEGKARLDLWKANELQLLEFGVRPENIELSDLCTVKNNQSFFSARRGDTGRFAAGIVLCD